MKVLDSISGKIKNEFVFVHKLSPEMLRTCTRMRVCDKVLEVSDDVFIRVCGESGKTWVSSSGNNRLMLMHARAFEETIEKKIQEAH